MYTRFFLPSVVWMTIQRKMSSWAKRRICKHKVDAYRFFTSFRMTKKKKYQKKNKNPRNQRHLRMKNETPTKNYQLSTINYYNHGKHKQNTLEQNPEHRHHRANRHCHHLRRNLVHGSVKKEEAKNCLFLVINPNFFFTFVTYKEKHSLWKRI